MKAVFKMTRDFGRMGEIEGVFIAEKEHVDLLCQGGIVVYFGEILGKHSEIYCNFEPKHIQLISEDQKVIDVIMEHGLSSGYNPFSYTTIRHEREGFQDMECWEVCETLLKEK
jgi:hypothetical protein